jgi:hypothetical protein
MSDWQNEFVTVKNETDRLIEWDGRKYPAGSTSTVPYLNMVNTFGDPRATNGSHQVYVAGNGEKGVIQPRESERQKVMTYWKDDLNPRPTFYTMDGERLYTVADDPFGNHVMPASMTVDQQTALQKTVERQQQVINRLLEVAGLDSDAIPQSLTTVALDTAPDVPSEIPTDDSTANETQSPWAHDGIPTIEE